MGVPAILEECTRSIRTVEGRTVLFRTDIRRVEDSTGLVRTELNAGAPEGGTGLVIEELDEEDMDEKRTVSSPLLVNESASVAECQVDWMDSSECLTVGVSGVSVEVRRAVTVSVFPSSLVVQWSPSGFVKGQVMLFEKELEFSQKEEQRQGHFM